MKTFLKVFGAVLLVPVTISALLALIWVPIWIGGFMGRVGSMVGAVVGTSAVAALIITGLIVSDDRGWG